MPDLSKNKQTTIAITGDTVQYVETSNGTDEFRVTMTMTTNGTALKLVSTCPSVGDTAPPDGYTASPNELLFFVSAQNEVITLTKQ